MPDKPARRWPSKYQNYSGVSDDRGAKNETGSAAPNKEQKEPGRRPDTDTGKVVEHSEVREVQYDYDIPLDAESGGGIGASIPSSLSSLKSGIISVIVLRLLTIALVIVTAALVNALVSCFGGGRMRNDSGPLVVKNYDQSSPGEQPEGIFALRIQVRASEDEVRRHMKKNHPWVASRYWKLSESNGRLLVDPRVSRPLPFFFIEPRPENIEDFERLVQDGLDKYRLYVFPYQTDQKLGRIAVACGYDVEDMVWIKQWSTWREGEEFHETTKCIPGGACLVLAKSCDLTLIGRL